MNAPAERGVAVVTGASSGIGAATHPPPGRRGVPRGRGRPPAGPAHGAVRVAGRSGPGGDAGDLRRHVGRRRAAAHRDRGPGWARSPCWSTTPAAPSGSTRSPTAKIDDWQWMYDVNVLGTVRVTQALLPELDRSGAGTVVIISSTAGLIVYEGGGGYAAAKHAQTAIAETLRLELCGRPIRVVEIDPGMVRTDEFGLVRFDGDAEKAAAPYAGVARTAGRRRHRRLRRVGRHPTASRQPRPHRRPPARPGRPAQGRPSLNALTPLARGPGPLWRRLPSSTPLLRRCAPRSRRRRPGPAALEGAVDQHGFGVQVHVEGLPTPSRISRASPSSAVVVPSPRLVSARVCLPETATPACPPWYPLGTRRAR